jgi:hypothetical protein
MPTSESFLVGRSCEPRTRTTLTYLENDRRERKAIGSYYTPDHIVAYIVEQTVGPVVKEKFDALRPALRRGASVASRSRHKRARHRRRPAQVRVRTCSREKMGHPYLHRA